MSDPERSAKNMKRNWWIDYKNQKGIVILLALSVAAIIFCFCLPNSAWKVDREYSSPKYPAIALPLRMLFTWIGGWFVLLLIKIEDPRTYQWIIRFFSGGMISIGFAIGAFLYF